MKSLFYIVLIGITLSSCSEFQKAIKSEDVGTKFKLGTALYDAGKYNKANRLFLQIVPKYRGKPQAEKLMYMHAKCYYELKDYYTSNYHMERFVNAYPKSEKAEEVAFLGAKSYYNLSPVYSKEQKETVEAITKMQSFINRFPNSTYLPEANTLIKEMDYKLEKKAFSIAKQYNLISDYQASIKAFNNFILEFPGTSFREEAMFYRFDAAYKLAINSVEYKKQQRLNDALNYYNTLKTAYNQSPFLLEANEMLSEVNTLLEIYKTKI